MAEPSRKRPNRVHIDVLPFTPNPPQTFIPPQLPEDQTVPPVIFQGTSQVHQDPYTSYFSVPFSFVSEEFLCTSDPLSSLDFSDIRGCHFGGVLESSTSPQDVSTTAFSQWSSIPAIPPYGSGLDFEVVRPLDVATQQPRKRGFDQTREEPELSYQPRERPVAVISPPLTTNSTLSPASPPHQHTRKSQQQFPVFPCPFLESSHDRHPAESLIERQRRRLRVPKGGINGYIKVPTRRSWEFEEQTRSPNERRVSSQFCHPEDDGRIEKVLSPPPPNFATGIELDHIDALLLNFHLTAYSSGRTLLPHNYWKEEVVPMAMKDECVRRALLAFTAAYVLDFEPTETMRSRANEHYRLAVEQTKDRLRSQGNFDNGNWDSTVAAVNLLGSNDIVNWELRRPKERKPQWWEANRIVCEILEKSDPGHRYWKKKNIQSSNARVDNANWAAYVEICAQAVSPLPKELPKEPARDLLGWLLNGDRNEIRKIRGETGVCPKLLHMFSQITTFAVDLDKDPESLVTTIYAENMLKKLATFKQWFELGEREPRKYVNGQDLSPWFERNSGGKATTKEDVVALSAYAWIPAAEIYLHCRVFRKPRSHPDVQASLKMLIRCIKRLPCSGRLFTAQSPFFPICLMAIVSQTKDDRDASSEWFQEVLSEPGCRSSVLPVWYAVQKLWNWLDNEFVEQAVKEEDRICQRKAWWEEMVGKLVRDSGILSLV